MIVLIIIGIVLFILALINWGQSEGYVDRIARFFGRETSSSDTSVNQGVVTGGGIVVNNSPFFFDEDYAYNDDYDYYDES